MPPLPVDSQSSVSAVWEGEEFIHLDANHGLLCVSLTRAVAEEVVNKLAGALFQDAQERNFNVQHNDSNYAIPF